MVMFNKNILPALVIIFAILLSYSNTLKASFHFDDFDSIVYNGAIKDLNFFWGAEAAGKPNVAEHVKPLLKTRYIGYLSFALNYRFHGLDVKGYHLTNIAIHIFSSLLVYFLIMLTFRTPYFRANSGIDIASLITSPLLFALFIALLFAVHPVQTQAVTYIVQRFTSLAAMFYLLSLSAYVKFRIDYTSLNRVFSIEKPLAACFLYYAASLLSAIFAMKTKEFAFTLPLVMVLYEVMFLEGRVKLRAIFLAPFIFTVLLIPLSLTGTEASLTGLAEQMSGAESTSMPRETYLITQFRVIVTYLRLLFFPINQNLDYDYPIFENLFDFEVFISLLLLLSILVLGIYLYRISMKTELSYRYQLRLISFGIFWFFITIAAESSIVPIADVIYEHRLYLPSFGFLISAVAAVDLSAGKRFRLNFSVKNPFFFLVALAVLVLSCAAVARNGVWKDSTTLFEDVVHKSPRKARAHYSLAMAYHEQGQLDEAISEYKKALGLNLAWFLASDAYNNLGVLYGNQGHLHESVNAYKTALNFKPHDLDVRYNLALVFLKQGLIDDAINEIKIILNSKQDDAKIHYYLGVALSKKGRNNDALKSFQLAEKIDPGNPSTLKNIKILLEKAKSNHDRD